MRGLILWLCVSAAYAQGDVTLRLLSPHEFHQGELIQAELKVPEQWHFAGLLLDPPGECGTVAKPCLTIDPGGFSPPGLVVGAGGVNGMNVDATCEAA